MDLADLQSLDRYEYGFQVWHRRTRLLKAETLVLDARYFMLVVEGEGEGELVNHSCGPDCACFEKKEKT